jgi:hypothetical protein
VSVRYKVDRLRERDGDDCWICGGGIDFTLPRTQKSTEHPFSATVDHVVQRSEGGPNTPDNLRLAHKTCNHWMLLRDFCRPMRGYGVVFGLDNVGFAKPRVRSTLLSLSTPAPDASPSASSAPAAVAVPSTSALATDGADRGEGE